VIYASWGQRWAAITLDSLAVIAVAIPLAAFFKSSRDADGCVPLYGCGEGPVWVFSLQVMVFFVTMAYAPLLLSRLGAHNGQTLGKQALGIRVRHVTGTGITFGQAVLREVLVRALLFNGLGGWLLVPSLLDNLWPLWEPQHRALHDLVASTIVIRDA
jgi:uncharacterized RDD family membrane protein YckC